MSPVLMGPLVSSTLILQRVRLFYDTLNNSFFQERLRSDKLDERSTALIGMSSPTLFRRP